MFNIHKPQTKEDKMNNKHKLIKQLSKMTVNEMAFKLAEHKQVLKDFKEKSDLLQEQLLISVGCVKIKDDKKVFIKPLAKSFSWKGVKTWLEVVNNKKVIFDSKAFKNAHADLYAKFKNKPVDAITVKAKREEE
tara:strand:+ start:1429 stop:1830 length:402 start_codon:yes stop_codon:yes gene_type:complete